MSYVEFAEQQLDLLGDISSNVFPIEQSVAIKSKNSRSVRGRKKKPVTNKKGIFFDASGMTFDKLLVGRSNKEAFEIAKVISESPGELYPSAYLIGGCGVGKTHILHSIANTFVSDKKKKSVLYVSGREFLELYEEVLKTRPFTDFLYEFIESLDALIIDDIQKMFSSYELQEDFCQIFDLLKTKKIQMVFAGNILPKDITEVNVEFLSRISSGLICDIGKIDQNLAFAYIEKRMEDDDFLLSDEVCNLIVNSFSTNLYKLESAFLKLKSFHKIFKKKIDLDTAIKELRVLGSLVDCSNYVATLVEDVAKYFNISVMELKSKSRKIEYSFPRHVAMYILNKKFEMSFAKIGSVFERDHTSIMYAVDKLQKKMVEDMKLKLIMADLGLDKPLS